jgi:hypothetical protein
MRSMVEGPSAEEPLHRAAPEAQFILSAAAGGVEGRGPLPEKISGRIYKIDKSYNSNRGRNILAAKQASLVLT